MTIWGHDEKEDCKGVGLVFAKVWSEKQWIVFKRKTS